MKIFLCLSAALSLAAVSGAAEAAERTFSIFGFEDIRINNGVDVVLTTGRGSSARAEGEDREILDRVSLQRNGKQLIVSVRQKNLGGDSFHQDSPVTLYLSSFAINSISHLGSGLVKLDELSGRNARVIVGGFGTLQIDAIDTDRLDVAMRGGGQVEMSGEVRDARIELQGASIFESPELMAERLTLIHRGPASSHLAVERQVDITNNGTGRIQIVGRPNCNVQTDGAADIVCNPER